MVLNGDFLISALSTERLARCVDENPSLRGYLRGYISEEKLRDYLESTPGISEVKKIPDLHSKKGDFIFKHEGVQYSVELKSLSDEVHEDILNSGHKASLSLKRTGIRTLKDGRTTICLDRNQFDILAICTVSIDGQWDFKFILNKYLPSANIGQQYLSSNVVINTENTPMLRSSILEVLTDID
jgi:hypothetical protein